MTDPVLLEYWGTASFRGINDCPICLERKPCPCDEVAEEPDAEAAVEASPAGPRWLERRDLA